MKLVTFSTSGEQHLGVIDPDAGVVRDLSDVLPAGMQMVDLIESWSEYEPVIAAAVQDAPGVPVESVQLLAPIAFPRRNLFAVGKNYVDHVAEFGRSGYDQPDRSQELPEHPIIFTKATTSVTGPGAVIDPHRDVSSELDYEGELAVIIGTGGTGISREAAPEHVWGYTIVNDVTARDLQRIHKQWLIGKSLDTHAPMGPWAVTADEINDVGTLEVETTVNGERRQFAPVKDLIFDIPELIAVLSGGITLLPGDIILTGTPAGVGIGFDPPKFLQAGDVVEVSVTGLGTLSNTIG